MPNRPVAMHTRHVVSARGGAPAPRCAAGGRCAVVSIEPTAGERDEVVNEGGVAAHAVGLQYCATGWLDRDGLFKGLRREQLAVPVTVLGLCEILGEERRRQMTVDASSH